jgi:DNA-binding response OmpR family regulator
MRLLVVEDDNRVMAALRTVLARHGFEVACAGTGEQALEQLRDNPDVVLLDLGLPDQDGFKVCRRIRETSAVPVIVVTARGDFQSRVHGLNLGADDYLVKPYNAAELIARIHAVTRRSAAGRAAPPDPEAAGTGAPAPGQLVFGPVRIDPGRREVTVDGRPVPLTRKEFDLLLLLARQPGVVYRREQIISEVWHTSWSGTGRTLEVHVASLRHKLGTPGLVETVRGVGYRLVAPACAPA